MSHDKDVEVLFDEDFGVQAVLNDAIAVVGIFDEEYQDALGMAATAPAFICASRKVANARTHDRLRIGDDVYRIVLPEPDGTGVTVLRLMKG